MLLDHPVTMSIDPCMGLVKVSARVHTYTKETGVQPFLTGDIGEKSKVLLFAMRHDQNIITTMRI